MIASGSDWLRGKGAHRGKKHDVADQHPNFIRPGPVFVSCDIQKHLRLPQSCSWRLLLDVPNLFTPCISHMPPHKKMNLSWQTHKIVYLTIPDQASFWRLAGYVGLEFLGNETSHGREAVWEILGISFCILNVFDHEREATITILPQPVAEVFAFPTFSNRLASPRPKLKNWRWRIRVSSHHPTPSGSQQGCKVGGAPLIGLSSSIHEIAVQGSRLLFYWGFFVYLGLSRYIFWKIETTWANWGGICFEENKAFPG